MSWSEIKKKKEEEEKKRASKKSNSDVSRVANNLTGSLWKNIGQNIITSQRNAEIRKQKEQQEQKKTSSVQSMPTTYKRTLEPTVTRTMSQGNNASFVKQSDLKNQKLETVQENTTWGNIVNFVKNTGRTLENIKTGAYTNLIGLSQTAIRDISDVDKAYSEGKSAIRNTLLPLLGDKGKQVNNYLNEQEEKNYAKRNEALNSGLQVLSKEKQKANEDIQRNVLGAKLTDSSVATKMAEIAPSIGQQIPGFAFNAISPVASLLYFKGSAEANYYDDAISRGMEEKQAKIYSKLMSYVEAGTEQLSVGNISKGGKTITTALKGAKEEGLKKGLKAGFDVFKETAKEETANTLKSAFKDYGIGVAEEAFQEAITEPIQEFTAMKVAGEDKADWNNMWQRMLQSGFDGALSSAILAGANLGISSCQGIVTKIENGQDFTTEEYNTAIKDASQKIDIEKLTTDQIKEKVNQLKGELQQPQVRVNENVDQEIKTSQNGFSQAEKTEALRQEARNKLESIKQNYDENSYNQMQEFIETAPNEKALNQVINDLNKEAETKQVAPIKQKQEVQLPMQQETQNKSFEDVAFEAMSNYESDEVESPLKNRDMDSIGKQTKVNAYQYDNPKVKPYFQEMAQQMGEDLAYISSSDNRSTQKGGGTKLSATTKAMDILHNEQGYSYNQIAQGLQNIIDDKGSENNAISKKIELVIDEQLRNGYNNAFGKYVEPNQEYINTIQGNKDVQLPMKQEKPNIINKKVNEYIDSVKDNFKSDINIKTQSINEGDVAPLDYNKAGQSVLAKKAQNLVDRLKTRVFKNNNEDIHVSNTDIKKSISETLRNKEQSKYKKENIAVFSQLDKVIENGKEISSDIKDNKNRDYYSGYKYYVSNVNIDGTPYVVEFDTRLQDSGDGSMERHFRLERVYPVNKNEVVSNTAPKETSDNTFLNETTSINNSISQNEQNVKSDNTNINNMQNNQENMQQFSMSEQQKQNNFEYKESKNSKVDTFRKDASKYWDNSEKTNKLVNTIEKVINDKGYNIRLDDTLGDNVNGRIVTNNQTGEIEITLNPNSSRTGEFILGHELTHAIQTQEMIDLVNDRMTKDGDLRNAVEDLKKLYKTDEINAEVLADISGQLFGNQEFINNLSVEKPNVFKRIYDKIVSLANKITGNSSEALFIKDLKNKWEKAYRENTNNINVEQYSIETDAKGYKYVKADRQVISGNDPEVWKTQTQNYIDEQIRKNKDVKVYAQDGTELTITKNTSGKATFRNEVRQADGTIRKLTDEEFASKLRAETHIDELGEVSKHKNGPVPDTKNHSFAKDGFNYRTAYFEDEDGQYYKITMSVGKNGDINTIYNVGKMQQAQKNRSKSTNSELKGSNGNDTANSRIASINSIPQTQENVNSDTTNYSMQESENNSGSFNLSENKRFDVTGNENLDKSGTLFFRTREDGIYYVQATDHSGDLIYEGTFLDKKSLSRTLGEDIANYIVENSEKTNNEIYIENNGNIKSETDYMMRHRPSEEYGNGSNFEKNMDGVFEHPQWYMNMNEDWNVESLNALRRIRNKPDAEITIYRATPGKKINPGDWVTPSKKYAELHNNSQLDGKGNILELKVKAKDILWGGDDINEFGYYPNNEKYSKQNNNWQDYLESNYKSEGTTTDLRDIRLPMKEKQEVKAPLKQGNVQQNQNNNTPGENINWNEIERPENNQKFRKHYRSIIESSNTTAEAKAIAKELMGRDTYEPETNKGQLAQADQRIMTSSPEVELQALRSRVLNGERITSVDIAVGERLIQYFSKTGSAEQLQDAIQTTALAGTSTGQTLQALTILNHQTPQGQVTWLQRSIDKMNKELAKKKGGTITTDADGNIQIVNKQGKDITNKVDLFNLTPEMMNKIMQSENQEQMLQNIDEVYEELGQQVPKSMLEKVDSWRYFSMLANIRTHGRNMIGNFAMGKMQRVKDKIAGGIEDVVSKFNPEMERTKTLRRADKKTKEFAKNDFKNVEVQSRLELNESKFNPQSRLQNARRTFKSDAMENTLGKLFNLNDKLLEAEDGIGLKAGYQKALADYITANKIDVDNITDSQLNKARNYAVQQAKEATFHQANAIASAVAQFENKNLATKLFTGAVLPFKKTPMNVAKAGMEYSPLQIAKSATVDLVNLRKGNISVNQYIDNLSKGMTGTGIALVGYALANAGILKASGGDDKDKEKYEEEQGKQSYSIQIAGKTYSLDWLAPTGIPLFIGAETHKLFNQEETEKSTEKKSEEDRLNQAIKGASNLLNAGATAINPMSEMSMISGLTSALSSYNTSDNLGSLGNIMTNAGKSYVNQFFPTLMGQVAKTTDKYERTTKSTATGTIGKAVDQTINQIKNKIPGLRQTLPIKTDIWGKELKQEVNLPLRAINNFINPATVKNVSTDKVDMELNKLYEENHSSSLLPDILTKTVQLNKQTYRLSNKEYAEFTKNYGQTSHKLIENFIKTSDYNKLTQEQKETAISNIYSYAKEQNKMDYAKKVNETVKPSTLYTTMKEIEKNGGKQSEYLSYLAKTKGMSKESEKNKVLADSNYSNRTKEIIYTNGTGKDDNLYNNLLSKSHINMTEYLDYKDKVSSKVFSADKDKNGKTVTGSAKAKVINYLNNNITGVGNRLLIAGKSYALQNNEKQKLAQYINSIANTREERVEIYKQLDKNFYVRNGKVYMRVSK